MRIFWTAVSFCLYWGVIQIIADAYKVQGKRCPLPTLPSDPQLFHSQSRTITYTDLLRKLDV